MKRLGRVSSSPQPREPLQATAGPARLSSPRVTPLIDHTVLRPDATETMLSTLCDEAVEFGFAAVCVNPVWVPFCARRLIARSVQVCTVVGFPLGAMRPVMKAFEAERVHDRGAQEIDMVLNVGALKSGQIDVVRADISGVRGAIGPDATLKVILETALLTEDEKRSAAAIAVECGADFVKTSTGFGPGGATIADVRLLAETVGDAARVKASGGIRDLDTARGMVDAGARRLGTSSSVAIARAERLGGAAPRNPLQAVT